MKIYFIIFKSKLRLLNGNSNYFLLLFRVVKSFLIGRRYGIDKGSVRGIYMSIVDL